MKWIILIPLLCLFGCSEPNHIILDPILGLRFFPIPAGTNIGDTVTNEDGWFLETKLLKGLVDEAKKKSKEDSLVY